MIEIMKQEKQMIESCRNWLLQHGEILNIKYASPIILEQCDSYWQIKYKLYLGYSLHHIMYARSYISESACWCKLLESAQQYLKENEIHLEIISEYVVRASVVPKQTEE